MCAILVFWLLDFFFVGAVSILQSKIYYCSFHFLYQIAYFSNLQVLFELFEILIFLQARLYINIVEIRNYIKPTLDWLLNQRFISGNFPSSMNSSNGDKLVQWCHGAPGFVPLCILAYQVFFVFPFHQTYFKYPTDNLCFFKFCM